VAVKPTEETGYWSLEDADGAVKHGYPPPRLSVGSVTTAYCGQPMIVAGETSTQPPVDTCTLCTLAWKESRGKRRRPRPS
jgi:hypothetical protein